jgi:uncharacterized protein YcaQ
MKKAQISLKQGRRMVLNAQLLDGPAKLPKGKEGVAQTVEELGYVQIDTISVIERAHHHTLWSRRADYDPQMLYDLQAKDRRIFEYWGHAASYLPMSDYRYYLPRMQAYHDPKGKWEKERLEKYGHWIKPVLKRVLKEGPLSSKDFEPTGKKGGPWWDWKPAKAALELLFWRGELMITERRNFHRVYDLTERVLPKGVDTCVPDDDELGQFLVRRALSAYALAQEKEIREHIRAASKKVISKSLADLVDLGEVMALRIKEDTDADYYALSEAITKSAKFREKQPRVFILSPFDNLIIQRERVKNLFGFDYALECYLPAAKRKFGYFTLPILCGENFVGRLDPKADRKKKTFVVRKLAFEPGLKALDEFLPIFANRLTELARFNQCEKIKLEKVAPKNIKVTLERLLKEVI